MAALWRHVVSGRYPAESPGPPKVTFVTRLQPGRGTRPSGSQLPHLSIIIRVEPSFTDVSCLDLASVTLPLRGLNHVVRDLGGPTQASRASRTVRVTVQ